MSTPSVQNLEEAAAIASEFIASKSFRVVPFTIKLSSDSPREYTKRGPISIAGAPFKRNPITGWVYRCSSILPANTVSELQQEIAKDSQKFIRHALRTDSEATGKEKPSSPPPTEKIKQAQQTLSILADEKIALAERIVELLSRKRSRLDHDLGRVLVLQGEPDPAAVVAGAAPLMSAGTGGALAGPGYVLGGRNPAAHINESLRNAFSGSAISVPNTASAPTTGSRASGTEENAHKSKRLTCDT